MADAAAKPVAGKLGIKPGDRVLLVGATAAERATIEPLPQGADLRQNDTGDSSSSPAVMLVVVRSRDELLRRFAECLPSAGASRAVWFLYPKGGGADVNRDTIMRETGAFGWRPNSNVSVDDTWSAVRVRPLAAGEAPVG